MKSDSLYHINFRGIFLISTRAQMPVNPFVIFEDFRRLTKQFSPLLAHMSACDEISICHNTVTGSYLARATTQCEFNILSTESFLYISSILASSVHIDGHEVLKDSG